MTLLISGVAVFVAVHLLPSFPGLRAGLVARIGAGYYRALFSLGALAGLGLVVAGFARAPFVPLWQPPDWGRYLAMVLMFPALVLLAGAHMPGNLKRFVSHPMLWGVVLWAIAHLAANGDQASLILFGRFGGFALFDMWSANRRGAVRAGERRPPAQDLRLLAAGAIAYVVLLLLHPYLFRMPVLH